MFYPNTEKPDSKTGRISLYARVISNRRKAETWFNFVSTKKTGRFRENKQFSFLLGNFNFFYPV